jgi:hypothetical protein
MGTFSMLNKTRRHLRVSPFVRMKEKILGEKYELSLAFVGPAKMKRAMVYKKPRRLQGKVGVPTKASGKKDKISNVLSFPLSKHSGEIIICPQGAAPYTLEYLFIHGLLHLKGLQHGATMDAAEERWLQAFEVCKKSSQV